MIFTLRRRSDRARTVLSLLFAAVTCAGCSSTGVDVRLPRRAITVYGGRYSDSALTEELLISKQPRWEQDTLVAAAYSQRFHRFWDGGGQWEWEAQLGRHFKRQNHWEINGLVTARWMRYPWSEDLRTSLAWGNGLSYATKVPPVEASSHTNTGSTNLLYYILLELTFGLPSVPEVDLVFRVHHRSGVFGLFDGVDGGSNVICVGLKFGF